MPVPFSGGCLCKAVRYECTSLPTRVYYCYCKDCQKAGGGPFASCIAVPSTSVTVTQGQPKAYTVTANSGYKLSRKFCGACGSPLFTEAERFPDSFIIKIGSMDDPTWLTPTVHIWTDSAWPWIHVEDDLPRFAKSMTPSS